MAQRQTDTLTPGEVQQLRDNAVHPAVRIRLYLKFIGQRLDDLKHLAADSDARNRGVRIHNRLDEFTHLCDELQDNIDTYDSEHADIRKPLKDLIAASDKWTDAINAVPSGSSYEFAQKMAIASAQSASEEARKLSTEQEAFFKIHKKLRHTNGDGPQG
jgi:hypothetical protein